MSVMDRTRVCVCACVWVDIVTRMWSSFAENRLTFFRMTVRLNPEITPKTFTSPKKCPPRIRREWTHIKKKKNVAGPLVTGNGGNSIIFSYRARTISLYTAVSHTDDFCSRAYRWPPPFWPRCKPCGFPSAIIMTCTLVAQWNALQKPHSEIFAG